MADIENTGSTEAAAAEVTANATKETKNNQDLYAMSDHELLVQMAINSRKQLRDQRITTAFTAIILLVVVISVAILVPLTRDMVQHVDELVTQAETSLAQIDDTVGDINNMVAANEQTLNEAIEGLDKAMQAMNQIDLEGLNKSIQNLQKVVSPLASLFR